MEKLAARVTLHFSFDLTVERLDMAGMADFVEAALQCATGEDSGYTEAELREWFAQIWSRRVMLQQALLDDADQRQAYLGYLAKLYLSQHADWASPVLSEAVPLPESIKDKLCASPTGLPDIDELGLDMEPLAAVRLATSRCRVQVGSSARPAS